MIDKESEGKSQGDSCSQGEDGKKKMKIISESFYALANRKIGNCVWETKDKFTDNGFIFGSAEVVCLFHDPYTKGAVHIGLSTPFKNLEIYVTKSGKVRIFNNKTLNEWKEICKK